MSLTKTQLNEKWAKVLDHEKAPVIGDSHRRDVLAQLLENTAIESAKGKAEQHLFENAGESSSPTNQGGADGFGSATSRIQGYDPVLISLLRRTMPNMIAYSVAGVQAMTGPTGLIFAMRPEYVNVDDSSKARTWGDDAFYYEAFTQHSGIGAQNGSFPLTEAGGSLVDSGGAVVGATDPNFQTGIAMPTSRGELLGTNIGDAWQEMGFSIDKISVTARTRALKAEYSVELAQDLRQIHGLDAESELSNILASEILIEINREVIRTIYQIAKVGAVNTTVPGIFDMNLDSNGRWAVEKFKGLLYQIEREANTIAKETRRGKGNIVICSSDVASALALAGVLDTGLAMKGPRGLVVDDTGNTYAGRLQGGFDVFIDPYAPAGVDFVVVGYKGRNAWDAGFFYCPYVPLQMYKAVGSDSFQPRIGFKTRYGMIGNPFANGVGGDDGTLKKSSNVYYRKFLVRNLSPAGTVGGFAGPVIPPGPSE